MHGAARRWSGAAAAAAWATLAITGCAFSGRPLTTSGLDAEPHAAWNGTHFGIVHYHAATGGSWPQLDFVKVDRDGNVVASRAGLGSLPHLYAPYLLSGLVWNPQHRQFAFAYTKGKVIHFVRLSEGLDPIGQPLEIRFPGLDVNSQDHPTLVDHGLVWNAVKGEYGLSFITREHPYLQGRHDDVYLSRISAQGSFVGSSERHHVITCPGGCEKTSLAFSTRTGRYAVSYFKNDYPQNRVMLALLSDAGLVSEHEIMAGWNGWGRETRLLYDDRSDVYLVLALKDKPGSLNGHDLGIRKASAAGAPTGVRWLKSGALGFDHIVSASTYLGATASAYLVCASEQPQIHCWMVTASGPGTSDMAFTSASVKSWHPSLAVTDLTYLAWIQDGTLYFGVAK
jgi:hypothetical protein